MVDQRTISRNCRFNPRPQHQAPGTRGGVSTDGGGAIAGLYEFAPQEEVEAPEVAENGQAPELELAEA